MGETLAENEPAINNPAARLRRMGCGIMLALWFVLLLSPCFLIILATQGQIVIPQGDLPEQEIRIWLIMETEQRGIGFSSTFTHTLPAALSDGGLCLQTDVRYLLWQGEGETSSYCACWAKNSGENWDLLATYPSPCPE